MSEEEWDAKGKPIFCTICGGPIPDLGATKGICGYCDHDLKMHRKLHEYEDRLKERENEHN